MTQKEVLNFKPAPRLEQIRDKCSKQVDNPNHRIGRCSDSPSPRESWLDRIFGNDTPRFKRRIISAVIATDAKRFCHQIKTDEVLGTYRCLSNKTALAMIFKLAEAAEKSWRHLDGHNQFPKIILGVKFANGIEVVRPQAQPVAA